METRELIKTLIEGLMVVAVILALAFEPKLIAFEEKIAKAVKDRKSAKALNKKY